MEALLSKTITLKEPSLKRDDLLSVLDALAQRKIFPKDIYQQTLNSLRQILGLDNILLVSSKYVALALILQNLDKKYYNLYCSDDLNYFYFNQFNDFFGKISPLDINQYSLYFDPQILQDISKSILFFSYNLGFPVDIEYIPKIDIISIADFSGSLFAKFNGKYLLSYVDFAICSLKDEEIITAGDGALIYIKDKKTYDKINEYAFKNNLFLSDFNCSLLSSQLSKRERIIDSRKKLFFAIYEQTKEYSLDSSWFDSRKLFDKWTEDQIIENSSFSTFTIDAKDIKLSKSIAAQIGLEIACSIERPISFDLKISDRFLLTEKVATHAILIPFYPLLTIHDIDKIVYFIKKVSTY